MLLDFAVYEEYLEGQFVMCAMFGDLKDAQKFVLDKRKYYKNIKLSWTNKFTICSKENIENKTFKHMEF